MTVLAGGIVATYAVTGSLGVPLSFLVLGIILILFSIGYGAMSRHVFNAGAFYAYVAQGVGRAWGVCAAFVAVFAYNSIQIGLYGLLGFVIDNFAQPHFHLSWPWWTWALIGWLLVGLVGILRIDLNARVISFFLVLEVVAVVTFDVGAFAHPAGGAIDLAGFDPRSLFTLGIGGVFAFGVAAFVGFESGAIYSEEARNVRRTVPAATYVTVVFTGVLYAVSALALSVRGGTGSVPTEQGDVPAVVAAVRVPSSNVPFSYMATDFGALGPTVSTIANVLLITSIFAALTSFHNNVARYLFALGRERVLPSALARTNPANGAPVGGSLTQSVLGLVVIAVFAGLRLDPFTQFFTWLSYIAAVGVLSLMIASSLAAVGYFSRHRTSETYWHRTAAPVLSVVGLSAIAWTTITNASSVLGSERGSALTYILPGSVGLVAVIGLVWGGVLRSVQPGTYEGVGRGGVRQFQSPLIDTN
jgi:amino acid transporter